MFKKSFITLSIILLFSVPALAIEFSADMIMIFKGGDKTLAKVYYKADRFRMDMKSPQKGTVITRIDKKVVWNIMPDEKMYMEMPFNPEKKPHVEEKFEGEIKRKHIGNEIINGHPSKKFLVTYKVGKEEQNAYQWIANDIKFPVKRAAVDGSWIQEFKDIKMGPQPNSLFEIPAGYRKFQMPGGMMMPGGMNFK
ncbi:MAG: DUF4412 domain-containing protein [Nitrospirota bacterium]